MQLIHLFVDATGGDHAPEAPVKGSIDALRRDPNLKISIAGILDEIQPHLLGADDVMDRITLIDAPDLISNHDAPAMAIRQKKKSPIVMGMLSVRQGETDGFVSAGSTGAVLVGGMLRLGRIPGIERPALAPLLPNGKGHFLLIDCGANVDCKPEYLQQFGVMGNAYMQQIKQMPSPRIGLINVGEEVEKGNQLTKDTFPLMQESKFNFVGNVEARYITADKADVLVCDGFDGNIILKFMEGVASTIIGMVKEELLADTRSKIGGLLAKPAFRRVKKAMDYTEIGGAPLLGVQGAVVKAHGSCNAYAFASAIRQASTMVRTKVATNIMSQI
ncbi:MAG: phosphate acyltransferase PlsX [Clostridiales bacterium]|nr:phosphate acyltransferase PlsX [Clostridiales bacterium]